MERRRSSKVPHPGENGAVKIVGIAGGSGSGKTTIASWLLKYFGTERVGIISQDSYYHDQSGSFDFDGGSVNFDHPAAIDFDLMAEHLEALLAGDPVDIPIYDFTTHTRIEQTNWFRPREIILVDGILILGDDLVRELFDAPSREHADLILSGELPVADMISKIEASGLFAGF